MLFIYKRKKEKTEKEADCGVAHLQPSTQDWDRQQWLLCSRALGAGE